MELSIFFDPISDELAQTSFPLNSFCKSIHIHQEHFPDLSKVDIALIGLQEWRGSMENEQIAKAPFHIRQKLYALKKGSENYRIVDLGNLRNGIDYQETINRIKEVGHTLLEKKILPIFIGGTHDLDMGQFTAYENLGKLISVLSIDAFLDMEESDKASESHTQQILMHQPNFLFNYTHMAYQSFLVDKKVINLLEKLYFDHYRLGQIKDNLKETEPLIRNADMLSFDITAIRSADAPGNRQAQPFGLTGEEACQIAWFAGSNDKLSSIGFYGYQPALDDQHGKTAAVMATMIWYFIEGFYHRKDSLAFTGNDYTKYVVSLDTEPANLVFYKSKISGKWWMEVPHINGTDKYERNSILPCSYTDYEQALQGEVPERWINAQIKLI
ncbi:formimidoylglutamase [Penaeicola halotolerans]|uniref:formimidoylglutamase n=1 Tax=Penaeicola halotolerans TaxID=2793196 RepID=UPI001CF8BB33|nr:formimidoylglutamase [Penaeicola halotolerans]